MLTPVCLPVIFKPIAEFNFLATHCVDAVKHIPMLEVNALKFFTVMELSTMSEFVTSFHLFKFFLLTTSVMSGLFLLVLSFKSLMTEFL